MKVSADATRGHLASRSEWIVPAFFACLLALASSVSYILGYVTAPHEMLYSGLLVNVEDANYLTILQRGSEGAWMHSLRFTSEPDAPALLYVFYLALGHLAALLHMNATNMWHASRAVLTVLTALTTFGFVKCFIGSPGPRLVAYALALVGAGMDWFALPGEVLGPASATPVDLKMADAHLFSAALTYPHYLASILLLIVLAWCALRIGSETLDGPRRVLLIGLGALATVGLALVYPYFILLALGPVSVYFGLLAARERRIPRWLAIALGCWVLAVSPLGVYYAQTLASSELLRIWTGQSQTLSPNPVHYLLTFAPYLLLASVAFPRTVAAGPTARRELVLWAWVGAVTVLVYAPIGPQRRFLQGVQVPLAILATIGLYAGVLPRVRGAGWFGRLAARPRYSAPGLERLGIVLLVLIVSTSSIFQWLGAIAVTTLVQPYPLFRPALEIEAMDWLRGRASQDDVILASYTTGSYLPLRSGARAYIGHYYETIHFATKQAEVEEFWSAAMPDAARANFLRERHISYLFYGRAERELGAFDPGRAAYLKCVYENQDAAIYAFKPG